MESEQVFALSIYYYALVGILLGLLLTFPTYLLYYVPTIFNISSRAHLSLAFLAFLYVVLDIYFTRALHYDGLADLGDALGVVHHSLKPSCIQRASAKEQEKFWQVMHDSHLGTFGALALIMLILGSIIGVYTQLQAENWHILLLAPSIGRMFGVVLASFNQAYNKKSLGGLICNTAHKKLGLIYLTGIIVISLLFSNAPLIFLSVLGFIYYKFRRLALYYGGINGDFLGAGILLSQTLFLLF